MRVMTGKVVDGKIDVPADVAEGSTVAILVPDEGGFTLSSDQEQELAEAIAEIGRGEFVDGEILLAELRNRR
jgi:hypothetical protein